MGLAEEKRSGRVSVRKITYDDFVSKKYKWTEISRYALTDDGLLLRYDGDEHGFPWYECLFEGYWEVSDIGIGYGTIEDATPINPEEASKIIEKEEKPRHTRPKERDYWVS